jgi:hypothetical protein
VEDVEVADPIPLADVDSTAVVTTVVAVSAIEGPDEAPEVGAMDSTDVTMIDVDGWRAVVPPFVVAGRVGVVSTGVDDGEDEAAGEGVVLELLTLASQL